MRSMSKLGACVLGLSFAIGGAALAQSTSSTTKTEKPSGEKTSTTNMSDPSKSTNTTSATDPSGKSSTTLTTQHNDGTKTTTKSDKN
jgi:heme/copper-type cytochrome/quinol oxidase subunit 1